MGRAAQPEVLLSVSPDPTNPYKLVAPSPIPLTSAPDVIPHELSILEIHAYRDFFVQAALNAVEKARFDGVELHFANGCLLDQFLSEKSNQRKDEYGGSIEGRLKLPLEVLDAVVRAVGAEKVAVRLSPWSPFQGKPFENVLESAFTNGYSDVKMDDPIPTYTYIVQQIKERHPNLAFLHLIEPRIAGSSDIDELASRVDTLESNDFIRKIWAPRPIISAGAYTRESAIKRAETGELTAFGRLFISNVRLSLILYLDLIIVLSSYSPTCLID
jgi:NADPH2 dehydrogenase